MILCGDCAAVVANDDWTWIDHPANSDELKAAADDFLRNQVDGRYLVAVGPYPGARFRCPCCQRDDMLGGTEFAYD